MPCVVSGDDERQKRIQKVQQNRAKKLVQLQKQTGVDMLLPSDLPTGYSPQSPSSMERLCSVKVTRRLTHQVYSFVFAIHILCALWN